MSRSIIKRSVFDSAKLWGLVMAAEGEPGGGGIAPPVGPGGTGSEKSPSEPAEAAVTPDWESRFTGQQKVNRDLEAKFNALRDGLKTVLGVEDKRTTPDELLSAMRQQLDELTRARDVSIVARNHKITDINDLALLAAAPPSEVEKLAARLAPKGDDAPAWKGPGKPGTLKPDPSQGRGAGGSARATSVSQVVEDRRAARAK